MKVYVAVLVLAALLAASLMLTPSPAHATTFTVNSTGDPGSGGCNSTECTLAEAVAVANRVEGPDIIRFNIPGEGVKTIQRTSGLAITEQVTIDGYTQPGASPNTLEQGTNAKIMVELDGSGGVAEALGIFADKVPGRRYYESPPGESFLRPMLPSVLAALLATDQRRLGKSDCEPAGRAKGVRDVRNRTRGRTGERPETPGRR